MINQKTAILLSNKIKNYFRGQDTKGYMDKAKKYQMKSFPRPSKLMLDSLFNDLKMSPEKMSFKVKIIPNNEFYRYVNLFSTHINSENIPGRTMAFGVLETNTNKWVGFIRVSSVLMNNKARNDLAKNNLYKNNKLHPKRLNRHILNGNTIVPVQPFGNNCLGGKLLALICTSDWLRRKFDKKYKKTNIVMFETTSLYGDTKKESQYDGLRPFIRRKGKTESNFVPLIQSELFKELKDKIKPNIKTKSSNRKLLTQKSCFQEIKKLLPKDKKTSFIKALEKAKSINQSKTYYVSNYGFDNYLDVINEPVKLYKRQLIKSENYDKHNLENLIEVWRKKAIKKYQKLKLNNKLKLNKEIFGIDKNINSMRT